MTTVLEERELLSIHKLFPPPSDLDSLLTTLKSLGGDGGGEAEGQEEGTGLRLLEQMLHSTTFKRAQKVQSREKGFRILSNRVAPLQKPLRPQELISSYQKASSY